ncbi:uncharacterized protein LOC126904855 isoform X2 [Daktulosphaira vitifoliae]|nr:uncharacterized protein LOC126904855 isoform X2 [Daktulosphaira vitifoliae]
MRLDVVEKENVAIKSNCSCKNEANSKKQNDTRELSCKKDQLVEYLKIVTNENRKLWTKLSSLENSAHLSDMTKPKMSLDLMDNYLKYDESNVELNPNCIMVADEEFTSIKYDSVDESWPLLLSELNAYKEKLTVAKHLLADQNNLIVNLSAKYNILMEDIKAVKPTIEFRDAETLTSTLDSCQPGKCTMLNKSNNQSICPLCNLYIVETEESKMFEKLVEHVSSHFPEEEPETIIDSLSGHY